MSKKSDLQTAVLLQDPTADITGMKIADLEAWLAKESCEMDDEPEAKSMSGTLQKYRKRYQPSISASGRKSLNTGDEIATMLAGMEPRAVISAAERLLGMETNTLWDKYSGLNVGQQRMNAGNRIRGAMKRGDATLKDVQAAIAG